MLFRSTVDFSATTSTTTTTTLGTTTTTVASSGGGSGASGGAGGSLASSIFEGRGLITEDDLIGVMVYLGHDYGVKYSFSKLMAPLSAMYAASDNVVMSLDIAQRLVDSINLADIGLNEYTEKDIYRENAEYIQLNYPGADTLIVARGDLEYDSVTASSLSSILDAPILLVEPTGIPAAQQEILENRLSKLQEKYDKIYIIGGEQAVSTGVENTLQTYGKGVIRLGGETRYETSVEIAREIINLGGNKMPIVTSGRDPVLYTTTLANKYRSPIIYLDTPPLRESTFTPHGTVQGSLTVESFTTYRVISDNNPVYEMNLQIDSYGIKDAWMYVSTIGFDSVAEKWNVKLNGYTLAYKEHTDPIAIDGRAQMTRLDVGEYLKTGVNTLNIEGSGFNMGDEYYITGVTLVILTDSGEKTEYWINEYGDTYFGETEFKSADTARLTSIYFNDDESPLEFNGKTVSTDIVSPTVLRSSPHFTTIKTADVTSAVADENELGGGVPALTVLSVSSGDLTVDETPEPEAQNKHQSYVEDYLDQEKFEQLGMIYYKDTL